MKSSSTLKVCVPRFLLLLDSICMLMVTDKISCFFSTETKISSQSDQRYPVDINELISRTKAQLLLLQLPDSLPCVGDEDDEPAKPKEEGGGEEEPEPKRTYLRHLNDGQIGKLVRYKSGKCKLLLGDTSFNVELGMESGFLQDLMSVTTNREERSGNMINLGPIHAKLSATPDWEFLLEKSNSSASSSPSSTSS